MWTQGPIVRRLLACPGVDLKLAPIAAACLTLLSGLTAAQDAPGGAGGAHVVDGGGVADTGVEDNA